MKVICVGYMPLTEKVEYDFYLQYLIDNKYAIEYWDLTNIYFPGIEFSARVERPYVRSIDNYRELNERLSNENINDTIFIINITFETKVLPLFMALSEHRARMFFFCRGMLPMPYAKRNINMLKMNYLKLPKILFHYLVRNIANIYKTLGYVKDYEVVFAAGTKGLAMYGDKTRIIPINYFDYDKYLDDEGENTRMINGKYCVFLDEYLPYHTDLKMFNYGMVNPEAYFRSMNNMFKMIENKCELEVVIAAHPKAAYKGNEYAGRKILYDKTNELVKYCEFVITHMSTAVSYPVIYKKPIIFTYNDDMKRIYKNTHFRYIECFQEVLGGSMYNADSATEEELTVIPPDIEKYELYKYEYLTSKASEGMLSRDIVINCLKSLN